MEIIFNYGGINITYKCLNTKEKIYDIFKKCRNNIDLNSIIFLYSGNIIAADISISKIVNNYDLKRKKMIVIVNERKNEPNSCVIHSKDIICPKCGKCAKIDITEYKILLKCIEGHNRGNIFLDEYENTQKLDLTKIICDVCKTNNKADSYNNIFYRCNQCKKILCIQCQNKHNTDHNFTNYDDKNYICDIHNEKYYSYCKECDKNICLFCKGEHKGHELINYENILPNINELKSNINKLRKDINQFKGIIDNLKNRLNKVKDTIEFFYEINKNIFDLIINKYINYELIYSYNKLNTSEIINDINDIINNKNNNKIFKKLNDIYDKMTNKFCEEITINYQIINNDNQVKIFGKEFLENNKQNCKMIINGKEMEIEDKIELKNIPIKNNILEIKIKGIQNITNMNCMFSGCSLLQSIPDISNWNTINVNNMSAIFFDCSSLETLPDISVLDTSNVKEMNSMFSGCSSLDLLPDISQWNTSNVHNMSFIFSGCSSLQFIPEISKWDTSNVKDMNNMFSGCSSLLFLSDISNWNISNVENMNNMFSGCSLLQSLPDISKWNTINVKNMSAMFYFCSSLQTLPDISNWNTLNVNNMDGMFSGCSSLKSLPNISIWNITNVKKMVGMFSGCNKLSSIPTFPKK